MPDITLAVETGRVTGSSSSRRLRREGRIPGVMYGHGIEPTSVSVDGRDFRHALSGDAGLNQLLALQLDGTTHLALARELQRHPVRHSVVHVDFQVVSRDQVVASEVPITLIGEARAVDQEGGVLEQPLTSLTVHSVPSSIPHAIEVDISDLAVGDAIRVRDLPLPAGVTTELDPDEAVVVAAAGSQVAAAAEEAASGEGGAADGGSGAPADGASEG